MCSHSSAASPDWRSKKSRRPLWERSFGNTTLESGFSVGDLIAFYREASTYLLPHLRGRPLSFKRFPDTVGGESEEDTISRAGHELLDCESHSSITSIEVSPA